MRTWYARLKNVLFGIFLLDFSSLGVSGKKKVSFFRLVGTAGSSGFFAAA